MQKIQYGYSTKAIHSGIEPDPSTGAIMTPIFQTSTYVQESPGKHKGYEYARTQNPTRTALENNLAALEGGRHAIAYASGLGAIDAIIKLLNPGDEVVSTNDLYGGTFRIFVQVFQKYGIKFHFVDLENLEQLQQVTNKNTRLIWLESPTNPMLKIIDIEQITEFARQKGILTCVDNTFATSYLQKPIELGADMVMYSLTKYMGGHSDVIMGAVVVNNDELAGQLQFMQNAVGAVPGPMDCFLVLRGLKTLALRMDRHCFNAERIAHYLKQNEKVRKVFWPGFTDHPNHEVAKNQMKGFGGMISFILQYDTREASFKVLERLKLFSLAESLGGVESLCGHPATMTHASIPKEERLKVGLTDSLIRLSVGVEDVQDLIADLEYAIG